MRCHQCDVWQPRKTEKCEVCGSVAFYHGKRMPPLWEPISRKAIRRAYALDKALYLAALVRGWNGLTARPKRRKLATERIH